MDEKLPVCDPGGLNGYAGHLVFWMRQTGVLLVWVALAMNLSIYTWMKVSKLGNIANTCCNHLRLTKNILAANNKLDISPSLPILDRLILPYADWYSRNLLDGLSRCEAVAARIWLCNNGSIIYWTSRVRRWHTVTNGKFTEANNSYFVGNTRTRIKDIKLETQGC
jgi:hypothetical protein